MELTRGELIPALGVLLSLLLITLLISWSAWRLSFYQLPTRESPSKVYYKNVIHAYLLFLFVEIIIAPLLLIGWSLWKQEGGLDVHTLDMSFVTQAWVHLIAILLSLMVLLIYCCFAARSVVQAAWGECAFTVHAFRDLVLGIVTWVLCYPLIAFLGQGVSILLFFFNKGTRTDQVAVKQLKEAFTNPALFWATSLTIILIVPIIEELLFRGFLQTWLKGAIGRGKAIFLASLIFALFHFSLSQGWDNIEFLFSLFILGCYLGFIYERQRSLWASIGLHATFNAVSIGMIFNQIKT